jgi:hypothetical protein
VRKSMETAQAKRIVELEEACANLKLEKENVMAGYQRHADKYNKLEAKANDLEHEETKVTKMHVIMGENGREWSEKHLSHFHFHIF